LGVEKGTDKPEKKKDRQTYIYIEGKKGQNDNRMKGR
jgi:hypothetical protein